MMKKYFGYECKKNLILLIVLMVTATVVAVVFTATSDFRPRRVTSWQPGTNPWDQWIESYSYFIPSSRLSVPIILFMIMCALVPMVLFSFKMNSRQIDSLYSMSIKRYKIYIVKSIVGLIIVVAAFSVSFWAMVLTTASMPNRFIFSGFTTAYFLSLPIGIGLFGFNAFVFSRANRVLDGVIFVLVYSIILAFLFQTIHVLVSNRVGRFNRFSNRDFSPLYPSRWFAYSPIAFLIQRQENIIGNVRFFERIENLWIMYLFWGIVWAASWVGLILLAKKERAEDAERVSQSRWGYTVLIPLMIVTSLLFSGMARMPYRLIWLALTIVIGGLMYVVQRRSFKLKMADIIVFASAIALGFFFSFLIYEHTTFFNTFF